MTRDVQRAILTQGSYFFPTGEKVRERYTGQMRLQCWKMHGLICLLEMNDNNHILMLTSSQSSQNTSLTLGDGAAI